MDRSDLLPTWLMFGGAMILLAVAFWPRSRSESGAGVFLFAAACAVLLAVARVLWFYGETG